MTLEELNKEIEELKAQVERMERIIRMEATCKSCIDGKVWKTCTAGLFHDGPCNAHWEDCETCYGTGLRPLARDLLGDWKDEKREKVNAEQY